MCIVDCTGEAPPRPTSTSPSGEWTVNDALLRYLAKEFEVKVSGEELLGSKLSDARLDEGEVAEIFEGLLASTSGESQTSG